MSFTIYMLQCPSGRRYVGCTKRDPIARLRAEPPPPRAWPGDEQASLVDVLKRYGLDRCVVTTLATVESPADAAAVETLMIERYQAMQPAGYNRRALSGYPSKQRRAA